MWTEGVPGFGPIPISKSADNKSLLSASVALVTLLDLSQTWRPPGGLKDQGQNDVPWRMIGGWLEPLETKNCGFKIWVCLKMLGIFPMK